MQSTNTHCGLSRTSAIDRWMVTETSPIFVGASQLGTLSEISNDWTARIIIANAIYLNAVNALDDDEADAVIREAFTQGGNAGQRALAPTYAWVYPKLEAHELPSQIMSRVMLYLFSINWTVVKPFPAYSPANFEPLEPSEMVITLEQFPDGDYSMTLGGLSTSDAIGAISMEVSRFVMTGFADVDHTYFSSKSTALECAGVAQKYLKEKWGYDFSVKDET
ncbi:hypothetical protein [Leisingera sp. ANG-M1]|uniref:hypothetical protein n=1 Tax=Leisingera sp. ANG-M1 TaxID=1577895 RepID=UPI001269D195|nr:hypothetical protein [Leisingera sp. ANG-M1]